MIKTLMNTHERSVLFQVVMKLMVMIILIHIIMHMFMKKK